MEGARPHFRGCHPDRFLFHCFVHSCNTRSTEYDLSQDKDKSLTTFYRVDEASWNGSLRRREAARPRKPRRFYSVSSGMVRRDGTSGGSRGALIYRGFICSRCQGETGTRLVPFSETLLASVSTAFKRWSLRGNVRRSIYLFLLSNHLRDYI